MNICVMTYIYIHTQTVVLGTRVLDGYGFRVPRHWKCWAFRLLRPNSEIGEIGTCSQFLSDCLNPSPVEAKGKL